MLTVDPQRPARPAPPLVPRHGNTPWLAALASLVLLIVIGWVDHPPGKQTSFTLLYLFPILIVKWFVSRRAAIVCCVAATFMGLAVALGDHPHLPTELWNAGIRLGVYLVFCLLVRSARAGAGSHGSILHHLQRALIVSVAAAGVLAAVGWLVQRRLPLGTETTAN